MRVMARCAALLIQVPPGRLLGVQTKLCVAFPRGILAATGQKSHQNDTRKKGWSHQAAIIFWNVQRGPSCLSLVRARQWVSIPAAHCRLESRHEELGEDLTTRPTGAKSARKAPRAQPRQTTGFRLDSGAGSRIFFQDGNA